MSSRLSSLKQSLVSVPKSRLQLARESVKMDGEELKDLLFGEGNFNNHVKPTIDFIDQNRHIFTQHNIEGHSIAQQRKEGARMMLALRKFWKMDLVNQSLPFAMQAYAISMYNVGMFTKSLLQYQLYAKSLLLYGSTPKHTELYQRAITGQDMGCFSLTEFHHGSYSKGIQTLAVYDPKTNEFVLTTQGTKGMKFWIGALSEVSNVTILWAQLVIKGKSEGPHPFYLPIRCAKTHRVLPGITIGECGPKKGMDYLDNGYMMLDEVRIPRENLLGKYGWVDEKGAYSSPIKNQSMRFGLHMSGLSTGRANVAFIVSTLNTVTIALRYAHSRKQFETADKKDETTIIDYPLTQMRIIPEISRIVVQIAGGGELAKIYCDNELFNDEVYLAEMHAISAAVKARYTWAALKASEECRTILGGHGYSSLSRIGSATDDIGVNVTWEGDNNVLLQQTSKYLLRVISKKLKTKVLDLGFVHEKVEVNLEAMEDNLRDIKNVEMIMQDLLRIRYFSATNKIKELSEKYKDKEEVDMHFHPEAGNALSLAFADYFTFSIAKAKIQAAKSKEVKNYFSDCTYLWALTLLQKQRAVMQRQIMTLCGELVARSVVATDFLSLPSHLIGSPFANPDGDGFKEYLGLLYGREGAFSRAKHFENIRKVTEG